MKRTSVRGRYPQKPTKAPICGRNVLGVIDAKLLLQSVFCKLESTLNQEALVCFKTDKQNADIVFVMGKREMHIHFTEGSNS